MGYLAGNSAAFGLTPSYSRYEELDRQFPANHSPTWPPPRGILVNEPRKITAEGDARTRRCVEEMGALPVTR